MIMNMTEHNLTSYNFFIHRNFNVKISGKVDGDAAKILTVGVTVVGG